ncbi:MAG: ferrous iron transport protein A [Planctomycetia bacterium]|jgi:Fe2+ transport system protein FeoA
MAQLATLAPGQAARIESIGGERSFRRRLMEMGFLPGTPVRLVRRLPLGGLLELEVRGSHVNLRIDEAAALQVGPL